MKVTGKYYKQWDIKETDFPTKGSMYEKLVFVARYGTLAPSSHNTQPWKFKIEKNVIKILPDYKRSLAYSDRANRELYTSLGCVLGYIKVAAEYFGLKHSCVLFPENELEEVAIAIEFEESQTKGNQKLKELFSFLTKRRTNRFPPLNKKIDNSVLDLINSYNDEKDIEIKLVTQEKTIKEIANIMYGAIMFAFGDIVFKHELSDWIRSVYTLRPDGIPLFDAGLPYPVTIFAPFLIQNVPAIEQATVDKQLVEKSPVSAILLGDNDEKEIWIKTGKVLVYLWLACEKYNIAVAPMAGIVEHEKSREKLKKLLNTDKHPLFYSRLTYTAKIPPHSPRRSLEDILK